MGATKGKDVKMMLNNLVDRGEILWTVPFPTPENMPWVSCIPSEVRP